jgi:AraC-like DNA-binding protein
VGEAGDDGGYTDRVLPDGCIDLIWDGRRVFVAGPDTGPVIGRSTPGAFHVGVRFRPGHAPVFLGMPAADLLDQRVGVDAVWGDRVATQLADELAALPHELAMRRLEAFAAARQPDDPTTTHTTDGVLELAATTDVDTLAVELGVTARTLHRRCVHGFGYGAKTLQQVLRFRRFLAFAERSPDATLSQLAADAGYADQSHLTRDCRRLSGLTPSGLLVSRGVRSVQDEERFERAG